jgi:hypothetical protein
MSLELFQVQHHPGIVHPGGVLKNSFQRSLIPGNDLLRNWLPVAEQRGYLLHTPVCKAELQVNLLLRVIQQTGPNRLTHQLDWVENSIRQALLSREHRSTGAAECHRKDHRQNCHNT